MDEKMHQLGSILAPTILRSRVRIPSTPSTLFQFYTVELLYQCLLLLEREKDENKQKDSGIDPFFTKNLGLFNKTSCTWVPKSLLEQSTWKTHWNDFLWRWQRRKTINNILPITQLEREWKRERERERGREKGSIKNLHKNIYYYLPTYIAQTCHR